MSPALTLGLTLLRREWRAGELRLLALAVLISVASVTSVAFFTDRVAQALTRNASQLLAADLVLAADHPVPAGHEEEARRLGLAVSRLTTFPSMVLAGETSQLAEVKAAAAGYPLRGELRVSDVAYGPERVAAAGPVAGEAWVDARLALALGVKPGDALDLGDARLRVSKIIAQEPDRGGDFFSIAPRLLINEADVARSNLIQPGSRASWRLLAAGSPEAVENFRAFAQPRLGRGERLESVKDARPEMRVALGRAEQFLGLAALASLVLASVAVVLATRRFVDRHLDNCAVLRCLGASQATIFRAYLLKFLVLGLAASLAGCALGYGAQHLVTQQLAGLIVADLPEPSLLPLLQGVATGLAALLAFALPPLLRLKGVPALRVLRREIGPRPASSLGLALGLAVLAGLLLWQAKDLKLGFSVLGGLAGAVLLAALLARLLVRTLAALRQRVGVAWRFGLSNVARRQGLSVTQVVAFGLGVMVLLTLTVVRGELFSAWREALPADAPNRFLIGIRPDQVEPIRGFLAERGLGDPGLFPMVRGRLAGIAGRPVDPSGYADDRARRLAEREFNLSWAAAPQADNRVSAGRFWAPEARGAGEFSVEEGLAKTLGIKLGDTLAFDIVGQRVEGKVTSLRSVDWDSFHVNFFVLAPPGVLESYPNSWLTAFHLPAGREALLQDLVAAFPNVTVIDVAALMDRVRGVMDRVAGAVQFVFLFTVAAGLMVLYAGIAATQDERMREAAILRTLGARGRTLLAGQAAEFAAVGLLAGLVASLGADALGWVLAERVLNLHYSPHPLLWVAGTVITGVVIAGFGALGVRRAISVPPGRVLQGG